MAIVKMKRLRLLAMKAQKDELLRRLVELGCVEVTEPDRDELPDTLVRESGRVSEFREAHRDLTTALGLLDRYAAAKDGLFAQRPEFGRQVIMDDAGEGERLELARRIIELDDQIKKLSADEADEANLIESLKPWLTLDVPLEYEGTKSTGAVIGSVPAAVTAAELRGALEDACPESELVEVSADNEQRCILVLFHESGREAVMEQLRSHWFTKPAFTGLTGTARENSDAAEKQLRQLGALKAEKAAAITAEKPRRDELKLAIDHMSIRVAEAEATGRLLATQSAVVLDGWVPAEGAAELEKALGSFDCAWEIKDPDPEHPEEVPIKLRSNPLTEPMTVLTEMYSLPAYNGVDPNPLMLPFFPLYFGIMFADLGYGILLTLGGLFLYRKTSRRGGTFKYFGGLMLECGIMSSIFGAVTGGFFGDAPTQIAAMFGVEFYMPALIQPLENPFPVLIGGIIIGVIQMLLAVCVNGWMLVRDGSKADAFWEVAPVFVVFGGLALGAFGISWIPAIVGVVMVVYAQGRSSKSIGGKIGGGLYGLYNFVSGWFGDILSYSRLMALMLSGSVIAQVFNSLGAMGGPVVFVIVFIVGHALNMALNLIGCFVHALRLQYLEYFGKFYREGGRPFSPLAVRTKYVDIKED